MAKVSMRATISAPPRHVWDLVGQFNGLSEWHPAVERSELSEDGTIRRLFLVGGGEIRERLEERDEGKRRYSYSILSGPLPVNNYRSTIEVFEDANGQATVAWSSEFDPAGPQEAAVKTIQGIYDAGLANLKTLFGAGGPETPKSDKRK